MNWWLVLFGIVLLTFVFVIVATPFGSLVSDEKTVVPFEYIDFSKSSNSGVAGSVSKFITGKSGCGA